MACVAAPSYIAMARTTATSPTVTLRAIRSGEEFAMTEGSPERTPALKAESATAGLRAMKEGAECCPHVVGAFEIREVPAVFHHDEAGPRYGLGDVGGTGDGADIVLAMNDQGRDAQPCELGKHVEFARQPRFAI